MSVIPSLSWVTGGTPDYITRQEVIDFTSSVVGFLSSGGLSSINFGSNTPNPLFSTINMNPTGSISMNGSQITTASKLGLSTNTGLVVAYPGATATTAQATLIGNSGTANQTGSLQSGGGVVRNIFQTAGNATGAIQKGWTYTPDGLFGASNNDWTGAGAVAVPGLTWGGSNGGNLWSLQNISTINGTPPNTTNTTFTTLTGNTLNANVAVNTPVVNNISSFNGSPVIAELDSTYNMTAVTSLPNESVVVLTTITTPFNIPPDSAVLASVNLRIGSFATGSPALFTCLLGLRVGGQGAGGGIFYPLSLACPTALTNTSVSVSITGIFQTPTASTTNTIEVIAYNTSGVGVTCQVVNPTSPANIVYAKVLY